MKITMNGEYACAFDKTQKIRVLCVDRAGEYPVVAMDEDGVIRPYTADGQCSVSAAWGRIYDLVPLQRDRQAVLNELADLFEERGPTAYHALVFVKRAEADRFVRALRDGK